MLRTCCCTAGSNLEQTRAQVIDILFNSTARVVMTIPLSSAKTTLARNSTNACVGRFVIEDVYPSVDGGRFPVKRIGGEPIDVWADILREGHDVLAAQLLWRRDPEVRWQRVAMCLHANDRWTARFVPGEIGLHAFAIEAWTDTFATWRRDFLAKRDAGQDVTLEAFEGDLLMAGVRPPRRTAAEAIARAREAFASSRDPEPLLSEVLADIMAEYQPRGDVTRSATFPLVIDRPRARTGAWYEMIPRSQGTQPGRHGTFDDCIARLPEIAELGFDVIYLTPIHPIGRTNRKGRNNALQATPGDPGSFYAIGSAEGGHDAVHADLGTLADFHRFQAACHSHGMEIALDFAVQCSPDHPWVAQHPEWFKYRPDGSIRFAENPPKKYQDIVNPDLCAERAAPLWTALRDAVLFWVDQGVRIFRVDNPHTKPLPFWEWLIRQVQDRHPDVVFLAEAFTRPKVMKALAKLGFTQSYTYFTWRTGKDELQAYLTELTGYPEREYYRPNFFVNTPDILPFHLQKGEPWIFKARAALAATLSGSYGIYNGFELLEHEPIPGREEYLDSEKYEIRVRDWNKPGNIKGYIAQLNRIRRANPALQQTSRLTFAQVDDGQVIGFVKQSADGGDAVAVAVALDAAPRRFWFHFGDMEIGADGARRRVAAIENLVTGERHGIDWGGVRLYLEPARDPAAMFRCLG
jgi:starch synthase (maltosyl-transferring)